MAETQKTPSGHETLQLGQRFLTALTHNEIATLLDVLIGALSPDMFEHVLDQLQPDTRQTVQTILVPPDPSDPTQEQQVPSVSLAKLEQTWAALWQEWDHIVAEAAQERPIRYTKSPKAEFPGGPELWVDYPLSS